MSSRAALVALSLLGCGEPNYRYGSPPVFPEGQAPSERCVAEKQLTLSASSGRERLLNDVSGSSTLYIREQSMSGDGFTFYRGRERLEVDDGLTEIGEPLRSSYTTDRDALAGRKRLNAISRPLFLTLIIAGAALSIYGITQLEADKGGIDKTGLAIVGAGTGAMVLGLPFLYFAKDSDEDAARYDLMKKLYLPSPADREKIPAALASQRARSEQACGASSRPTPPLGDVSPTTPPAQP